MSPPPVTGPVDRPVLGALPTLSLSSPMLLSMPLRSISDDDKNTAIDFSYVAFKDNAHRCGLHCCANIKFVLICLLLVHWRRGLYLRRAAPAVPLFDNNVCEVSIIS